MDSPSERAAALSARIHQEINAGRLVLNGKNDFPTGSEIDYPGREQFSLGFFGLDPEADIFGRYVRTDHSFYRLGAELRAIVLGNREGAR